MPGSSASSDSGVASTPIPMRARVGVRLAIVAAVWIGVGLVTGLVFHAWAVAPVAGWVAAAALTLAVTWGTVGRLDAAATATHATREDPTRRVSNLILVTASIASLGGVGLLLSHLRHQEQVAGDALGVLSVAASWFVVHTLFTLRYAALYYTHPEGGIDFNQKERPAYADFAYLGFDLGMTYQVSDTSVSSPTIRRTVLRHTLISYVLGTLVLGVTINLVASIAG